MDYVTYSSSRFQKQIGILQYRKFGEMQNHYNRKQILKKKKRMAKDNNPINLK
jgi:hypothetical protein